MIVALCALKRPQEVSDEAAVKEKRTEKPAHQHTVTAITAELKIPLSGQTLCQQPQKGSFLLFSRHPLIFHLHADTSRSHISHPHTSDVTANKWSVLTMSGAVIPSTHSSISPPASPSDGIHPHSPSVRDHLFTPGPYISHC